MTHLIIIETDDGQSVVDCPEGEDPTVIAEMNGGVLIDEGPFKTYEDAWDALAELESDEHER